MQFVHALRLASLSLLTGAPLVTYAAYSCTVAVTDVGVLYVLGPNTDSTGSVTLSCTRALSDSNSLSYRIKADNGLNWTGANRRVRRAATTNYLTYFLTRGTSPGVTATCGNTSNWSAPLTGTTNVITGVLTFSTPTSTFAQVSWNYCLRMRGNQGSPTAGIYTDTINVTGQYPNSNAGALTNAAPLTYTVGVNSQCVFNTEPAPLVFSYTSFNPTDQVVSKGFNLRCSNSLAWALSMPSASGTLMGLNYNLALSPASGTGTGNNQAVTLTGTIPAGQAGTCASAVCSSSQGHTLQVTY